MRKARFNYSKKLSEFVRHGSDIRSESELNSGGGRGHLKFKLISKTSTMKLHRSILDITKAHFLAKNSVSCNTLSLSEVVFLKILISCSEISTKPPNIDVLAVTPPFTVSHQSCQPACLFTTESSSRRALEPIQLLYSQGSLDDDRWVLM